MTVPWFFLESCVLALIRSCISANILREHVKVEEFKYLRRCATHTDDHPLQISHVPTVRLEKSDRDRLRSTYRKVTGEIASPMSACMIRYLRHCATHTDDHPLQIRL
ncbi:Uncharacterised protein r2_g2140 [Pycnogonum litorale]